MISTSQHYVYTPEIDPRFADLTPDQQARVAELALCNQGVSMALAIDAVIEADKLYTRPQTWQTSYTQR